MRPKRIVIGEANIGFWAKQIRVSCIKIMVKLLQGNRLLLVLVAVCFLIDIPAVCFKRN